MSNKRAHRIDEITHSFQREFAGLDVDELNWKQHDQVWSIAQNIHHVIVINESYYPIMEALKQGTYSLPFIGKLGFLVSFFGKAILKSVQPERRRKMKTFPIWEPSKSEISGDILHKFIAHQEELKDMIINAESWLAKGTVISSPANKKVVYKLETAFDIIITHEQRHLEQAKEVLKRLTMSAEITN